jgi:hypothetical protein
MTPFISGRWVAPRFRFGDDRITRPSSLSRLLCHEVGGKLNAGTTMWETVSTHQGFLLVPSHSSHGIRLIRRNGANYL